MPTVALVGETIAEEALFSVHATGPSTRQRRTLKHGESFAVLDSHGDMGAVADVADGLFHCDTRFLSRLELRLNGISPLLLGSNVSDDNSTLNVDLTNPDILIGERLLCKKDTLHIVRTLFVWRGRFYQRLGVRNHGEEEINFELSFIFASDFADIFEVRGLERERHGTTSIGLKSPGKVVLRYAGLDDKIRQTSIGLDPDPTLLGPNVALYRLSLAPKARTSIFVEVCCDQPKETKALSFFHAMFAAKRDLRAATQRAASVQTSNDIFNEVLCRSVADLYMLMTDTPEGPYPYAGIPWYSTTFGRDGIITAMQMLWCDARIARGVLRRLAAYQAKDFAPLADSEPGKILHEMRGGEMAALREVPFKLYFGSVDATPLFLMLAGLYTEHTGDIQTLRELWPNIEAALGWIDGPGDPDRDGFVEYHRADENGLVNQGWKDSHDAIFHADGSIALGPIALCEVQGYIYAAKRFAARGARRLGKLSLGDALDAQATELAERFKAAFWCEDIGTYALALDGQKRPCRVRTSNAGQVLFSGIAEPEHADSVMRDLMRPSFFSGWGIRTVAREESRYNPMSYHNGSVWPHDNALIAAGFARYGHKNAIDRVFRGLFDAASYMDLRRLPELYCGFQRGRQRGPTLYPVACSPQAWAAGTPLMLLQSSLGLEFDQDRNEILLRRPRLPAFLEEVTLRNLRLGKSTVDLMLRRHNNDVSIQVLRNEGQIRIAAVY